MSEMKNKKIAVLGAGSWGTTLAILLAKTHQVTMWEFDKKVYKNLASQRENKTMLPGFPFPDSMSVSHDLQETINDAVLVLFAVPSFALRPLCEQVKDFITSDQLLVTVIKGIEDETFLRMSEIINQVIPQKKGVVALSGPTHAEEVIREIPTTIVAACEDLKLAEEVQKIFMTRNFRVYTNDDIIGVEIGGAVKNIIAILAGISDGIGFGDNTKAAIMTRGLAEIIRLGKRMGAKEMTFSGLAGIGDLIVTCGSRHSRNRFVGEQLGKGMTIDQIISSMAMVAEGVKNCLSVYHLSQKIDVEMPLTTELYHIIYQKCDIKESIKRLLGRKEKYEHWE
ncbi:MAG: NAD(P)H-dependent glycerol-3-phosphate dehydrogenase [Spirochaetes bacterium]|nr:NAD(P)H-dependent glycerol-3-phosphate dehydrogenase [Spirochaetota bacterium]